MSSTAPLSQPVPFRVLLDEAVRQSRRHMRRMYPAVAFPVALAAAAIPVAQGFMMQAVPEAGSPRFPLSVVGFGAVMVVYLLVYYFGYGALFAAAVDALAQRPVSMRRAWGLMLRPRILGTLLLLTLAAGLGMVMCLVPGIYLGLLWSLALPVMVEEGLFGVAALRRSAELTRYNPQRELDADPRFKVFVIIMVGTLIGWVIGMLVQLPMIVIQQVLMLRDIAGGQRPDPARLMTKLMWLQVPSQMLGMLTQTAVHLYMCFGLGLLFFDVKGRKEGLDLEAAVARLVESRFGAAAQSAPESPTAE